MPMYDFICNRCGKEAEEFFHSHEVPAVLKCPVCESRMSQNYAKKFKVTGLATAGNYPMECTASGVGVEQIAQTREFLRKRGVDTDFNPATGNAILRDPSHRRAHLKALKLVDRDSFI